MPRVDCLKSVPVVRSTRVRQLEGLFDVPPAQRIEVRFAAELPFDEQHWHIGLIVGPSGCGKSTLAQELFPQELAGTHHWPADRSLVDAFPQGMSIKDITSLLTSVGFASVPSWLRPFHVLSGGEQFRAGLARALAEAIAAPRTDAAPGTNAAPPIVVIDEFTSVVDRTVARIGSAALAKCVRRSNVRFVGVSCHYDIIDWLDPDWIYEPAAGAFQWRRERQDTRNGSLHPEVSRPQSFSCTKPRPHRPTIDLDIVRVAAEAWRLFEPHHYLAGRFHHSARCFVALVAGRPAAFTAVLPFPHPSRPGWREHRTVCLPDFQGVGIGNALSDFVAGMYRATGRPYFSTTASPAMIRRRAQSPHWIMTRRPGRITARTGRTAHKQLRRCSSYNRITASFEYAGPALRHQARGFGIL